MNIITTCPCCSSPMLHHLRNQKEYWFCRHCWQEMPNLSAIKTPISPIGNKIVNLSTNLSKYDRIIA